MSRAGVRLRKNERRPGRTGPPPFKRNLKAMAPISQIKYESRIVEISRMFRAGARFLKTRTSETRQKDQIISCGSATSDNL